jgi:hypothetical protein
VCDVNKLQAIASELGKAISSELQTRATSTRRSQRIRDMKDLQYDDVWKAELNPVLKSLFEGIIFPNAKWYVN